MVSSGTTFEVSRAISIAHST
jgi:hypothetical protein